MRKLERIFLYTVLAILVFYVFLADNKVESQVAIQEEIRARHIIIVNDEEQPVILLSAGEDGGLMFVSNKNGTPVVFMGTLKSGGGMISIGNKAGTSIAEMFENEDNGLIRTCNKIGTPVAGMGAVKEGAGTISVFNKAGTPGIVLDTMRDFGRIHVFNKAGTQVVNMNATTDGKGALGFAKGGLIGISNEAGNMVVGLGDLKDDGFIVVRDENGEATGMLP